MNFSGIGFNTRSGRLLRFFLKLIPSDTQMPVLQGSLRGARWIVGSATHGCWLGSYEFEKSRLVSGLLAPGAVFYDIGANVGYYSLLASKLVGEEGWVIAFEPFPPNLAYLKKHLHINRITNVQVVEAALAEASGEQFFTAGSSTSSGHLSSQGGSLRVRTLSLDDFVFEQQVRAPHFLKIDVEGAEADVLTGGKKVLQSFRPVIFLATHGQQAESACRAILYETGYELKPIPGFEDEFIASPKSLYEQS